MDFKGILVSKIAKEKNTAKKVAECLLKIKAVFFRPDEPFTWASGIKSPVYCDNRLTLTAPKVRDDVENGLVSLIRQPSELVITSTNVLFAAVYRDAFSIFHAHEFSFW